MYMALDAMEKRNVDTISPGTETLQPRMPVQSVKPCAVCTETPSTLSLYAAAWNAAAQVAGNGNIRT
jgi:hypothetical protein